LAEHNDALQARTHLIGSSQFDFDGQRSRGTDLSWLAGQRFCGLDHTAEVLLGALDRGIKSQTPSVRQQLDEVGNSKVQRPQARYEQANAKKDTGACQPVWTNPKLQSTYANNMSIR
jgi:hypothetical protein